MSYHWKILYQAPAGRSVVRNIRISASRSGRSLSCETPSRTLGNFELSGKKNIPVDIPLPQNMPIYIHYNSIKGIVGDSDITNEIYTSIRKKASDFITKTDHVPLRVFALGISVNKIQKKYIYKKSDSEILKSARRYIELPYQKYFEFVTIPLYYGHSQKLMKKIINIGIKTKEDTGKLLAGFIDLRDEGTFSTFIDLMQNERMYSMFDLMLVKWANPDSNLNSFYILEDLLEKTYHHEKYPDFPPIIMVATQRENSYSLSGAHYTHIFGGDLQNIYKNIHARYVPDTNDHKISHISPPRFFNRDELTIQSINRNKAEALKNHPVVRQHSYLRDIVDMQEEWTSDIKKRSAANGLAVLLETYDSTKEFEYEQKYIKGDELKDYFNQKNSLRSTYAWYKLIENLKTF